MSQLSHPSLPLLPEELNSQRSQAEIVAMRSERSALAFVDRQNAIRRQRLRDAVETLAPEVPMFMDFDAPAEEPQKGRVIGYVRVSTASQDAALQRHALSELRPAPDEIIQDIMSGARADRPGLDKLLGALGPGDSVAIWKLDRLGRSLKQLIATAETINEKGASLHSVTEGIDTSTAGGRVLFHVLGALAEFERDTIRERVSAGMRAAKKAGKHTGRPARMNLVRTEQARKMLADGKSWNAVCRVLEISQPTLSRALRRYPQAEDAA